MRGLVLEGGGVKGAYHIGAYTALVEEGYTFDGFVGTSIGAINAALLAQNNWQKTLEMWDNVSMTTMLAFDDDKLYKLLNGEFDKKVIFDIGRAMRNWSSIINRSTDQLHYFLQSYVDEDEVRKSDKDYGLCTFSVPDFVPHYLMKEDIPISQLCDYIIASASYPLFRWQQISGTGKKHTRFIDGGVYDNMPMKLLISHGYKDLVVVRTSSKKPKRQIDESQVNVLYIVPHQKLAQALEFTQENVQNYKKMGYYDAKRIIWKLPSHIYCVRCNGNDGFLKFIECQFHNDLSPILSQLGEKSYVLLNANIDQLCDILREELGVDKAMEDYRVFIYFLETFAMIFNIDKYAFYNLQDFYDLVMQSARANASALGKDLESFLKKDTTAKPKLRKIFTAFYQLSNCAVLTE